MALALASLLCFAAFPALAMQKSTLKILGQGSSSSFQVEVARTPKEQEKGLMHRKSLPKNHGMLFPQKGDKVVRMWMKNTDIPLDMLFIDHTGQIVYIAAMAEPESTHIISANRPVRAVLELAGGVAAEHNIRVGDRVVHKIFKQ